MFVIFIGGVMARIDEKHLNQKNQERCTVHENVNAAYFFFDDAGEKYFQIDTYGSPDREVQGVPSQKVQFDKKTAEILIEILKKGFKL
jgi:hypothetical protein